MSNITVEISLPTSVDKLKVHKIAEAIKRTLNYMLTNELAPGENTQTTEILGLSISSEVTE